MRRLDQQKSVCHTGCSGCCSECYYKTGVVSPVIIIVTGLSYFRVRVRVISGLGLCTRRTHNDEWR